MHIAHNKNMTLLYPFAIFPFKFVIRAPDFDGVFLVVLPDIIVLTTIIIYILQVLSTKLTMRRKRLALSVLLLLHIFFSALILYFHVFDIGYIPILIRTYFLPLLFLFVMIRASLDDGMLPQHALRIFVISITFVACLALSQYFSIIKIPSNEQYLQPLFLSAGNKEGSLRYASRAVIVLGDVFRINLLTGGGIGSSGAVFVLVSILCFAGLISGINRIMLYVMGFVCFFAGLLSASTSVIIPISVFILLLNLPKRKQSLFKSLLLLLSTLPLLYAIYKVEIINDTSAINYYMPIAYDVMTESFSNVNLNSILFGTGPAIFSSGYELVPDRYIIDVGIFLVLQETGFFNFIVFFSFLLGVIYVALKNIWKSSDKLAILHAFPLITLCLLVHANFSIVAPFYVLFAGSAAGVLSSPTNSEEQLGRKPTLLNSRDA
ncbi:MAG TPA: hypothetical protein VJ161_01510 [Geobacteraceae bacterium]|nr:hypothetical protein [Geobacteraceae bacterium]